MHIALRLFYFCLKAQGTTSHTYPSGDQTVLWEGHPWVEEEACRVEVVLSVEKIQADQVGEAPFLEDLTEAWAWAAFLVDSFLQEGSAVVPVGALRHHPVEYLVHVACPYWVAFHVALCQEEEQVGKHQEVAFLQEKFTQKTFTGPIMRNKYWKTYLGPRCLYCRVSSHKKLKILLSLFQTRKTLVNPQKTN